MTSKIYKTAQGKTVDLGSIILKNETTRAVGNMNVNARGDKLDHNNRVVETKPRQIQRQNSQTTNVSSDPVHTSQIQARRAKKEKAQEKEQQLESVLPESVAPVSVPQAENALASGGLAAAIARSRETE